MEDTILPEDTESKLTFTILEGGESINVLEMTPEGFFYRGERVDDVHNVYERFNEWLTLAEKNNKTK